MQVLHLHNLILFLLSMLLVTRVIHCQDEEDDESEDDDQSHNLEEDATNNYINNFDESSFGSGESSEHVDELSGGMFDSDGGESDPIDWMDSKRRQSFVRRNFPFFFRRGKNDEDTIIQNNPGSYVKENDQEHFNSGNGNMQHVGDDIHSHSSQGEGGCSGGCDNDDDHDHHNHHHHDHHNHHDHSRHGDDEGHFPHDSHSHSHSDADELHNDFHRYDRHFSRKKSHHRHSSPEQFDKRDDKRANYNNAYIRNKNTPIADRMQRSTLSSNQFAQGIDSYDPEKRNRYSGYDSKDKSLQGGFTPMLHKSSRDHLSLSQFNNHFSNPFESALSPDPHHTFPRGSFYGLEGFYGDSKLMRDKLLAPYSLRTASRKMPCNSGCDEDDDKKKKK